MFATCSLRDGEITDWVAHPVGWDQTYGVDVMGAHHARVMRFVQDHAVTAVVADDARQHAPVPGSRRAWRCTTTAAATPARPWSHSSSPPEVSAPC